MCHWQWFAAIYFRRKSRHGIRTSIWLQKRFFGGINEMRQPSILSALTLTIFLSACALDSPTGQSTMSSTEQPSSQTEPAPAPAPAPEPEPTTAPLPPQLAAQVSAQTVPQYSNQSTVTITFTGANATGFECKLDTLEYSPCVSPYKLQNLFEGQHTVQVRARNATSVSAPAVLTWLIDQSPPGGLITSGPEGVVASLGFNQEINFSFMTSDSGGSGVGQVKCQFDNQAPVACNSSIKYRYADYPNLYTGPHTFKLIVIDRAGNETSVQRTFQYITPPDPSPPS